MRISHIVLFLVFCCILTHANPLTSTQITPKICYTNLDCGLTESMGYTCYKGFVAHKTRSYECAGNILGAGVCLEKQTLKLLDVCLTQTQCVKGMPTCQPTLNNLNESTKNKLKQNNTYTKKNYLTALAIAAQPPETKTVCTENTLCHVNHRSEIMCSDDGDCAGTWLSQPLCSIQGHAVKRKVQHRCLYPGKTYSKCVKQTNIIRQDYCGPYETCLNGECVDNKILDPDCRKPHCVSDDPYRYRQPKPKINYLDYAIK
ncbi:MAG: hypothetical protein GF334_01270 [Candidatus Altiarchaeales archaeon]|nr:hypothetical protein [Candidatus Altiarchaeales archaeon]